jgi:poly(hydroxyalkanoate) depolymerase family esterase
MSTVDWRRLYASNRAAIERARRTPGHLPGALDSLGSLGSVLPRPTGSGRAPNGRGPAGERTFTVAGRARRALVHVPAGVPPGTAVALVCMLHGCTQDAAGFAAATRMNAAADRHGFAVVYPRQERADNPNCCWNWFLPQHHARGSGEPESIAGVVRELVDTGPGVEIDPRRVFVAGLSAGGAMAAVMAATYPDLFAAVAVHSGLPYRSATTVIGALAAMAGRARDGAGPGAAAHAAMGPLARPIPAMAVHGGADPTVAPSNGKRLLEQFMAANRLAAPGRCESDLQRPTSSSRGRVDGGHAYARSRWTDRGGVLMHELLRVDEMGHGWSGGAADAAWTDPRGPDATEAIWSFFAGAGQRPTTTPLAPARAR